ncbi:MAG: VanZ family protein [Agathobacter sp.]|nr:VanZ family protein [Agathobacter sp.]
MKLIQNEYNIKKFFLVLYIIWLIVFVVLKFDGSFEQILALHQTIVADHNSDYNLIPFKTIKSYIKNICEKYAFMNIFGNIIPFIPLGYLGASIFPKNSFFKNTIICLMLITLIEVCQLVFSIGFFDIDDIILNLGGSICGIVILKIQKNVKKI